jgi:hypothetical protein
MPIAEDHTGSRRTVDHQTAKCTIASSIGIGNADTTLHRIGALRPWGGGCSPTATESLLQPVYPLRYIDWETQDCIWNSATSQSFLLGSFEHRALRVFLDDMDTNRQLIASKYAIMLRPADVDKHDVRIGYPVAHGLIPCQAGARHSISVNVHRSFPFL